MDDTIRIRRYEERDRSACLELSHRLKDGMAPWRDNGNLNDIVSQWVSGSIDAATSADAAFADAAFFVADRGGRVIGFASASRSTHFSGQHDCYVGELVVSEMEAGNGVGRALMNRVEAWAQDQGLSRVILDTGARNTGARDFYAALGYEDEEVKLSRAIPPA
ncbi:GNAT family N-acetyltransferase [Arthrobacter castelli]|uniref:GNAT family N-acetyltransferase n=1 Tax=Arthrobacter castelli TaxID=271431 RepID=UPI0003FE24EE|nr:GNAT family N-acetyltransferase [Arthrobacter castelli]